MGRGMWEGMWLVECDMEWGRRDDIRHIAIDVGWRRRGCISWKFTTN